LSLHRLPDFSDFLLLKTIIKIFNQTDGINGTLHLSSFMALIALPLNLLKFFQYTAAVSLISFVSPSSGNIVL
jgi:UDP-N-acetylmuramyl pentapeptide phosphotransferase/UDP-N-acetylglucosamine-1-phosphate transferase